ncbi:MAG: hypothetical protein GY740_05180 [Gammaproteobacteria bacterium]|nr:hypothetical protein [Gammaproteobacteria bacterium]
MATTTRVRTSGRNGSFQRRQLEKGLKTSVAVAGLALVREGDERAAGDGRSDHLLRASVGREGVSQVDVKSYLGLSGLRLPVLGWQLVALHSLRQLVWQEFPPQSVQFVERECVALDDRRLEVDQAQFVE